GLTAGGHTGGLAIARGGEAALRPAGRSLSHGNTQAVTIASGNGQVEGLRQCAEALAVACHRDLVRGARDGTAKALVEITEAVLDTLVGVIDIACHLAFEHTHAIEDLARFGEALLHTFTRLTQQPVQLGRVSAGCRLALQALFDETENPPGNLFRGVVVTR